MTQPSNPIAEAIAHAPKALSGRELVIVLLTSLLSIVGGRGLAIYEAPDRLSKLEEKVSQVETKVDFLITAQEAKQ